MSGDRWQRVNDLFHAALERGGEAREAFLREACSGDEALLAEVSSLIAADAETPAIALERLGENVAADWASGNQRHSLVGQRVDKYQVVAHLGSGGMGDVYRATDSVLGRDVALKVLAPALHADSDFRRRLEKEARAASSLNHPNIVTVYEIGQAGPIDFVASELVDGVTLRERIATGPLSLREIIDVGAQIGAALSTAHASGIVHRDIKPENVMIRRDGIVKVVDFGLAKRTTPRTESELASAGIALTQTGIVAGTACYMSPEQALGEPIDHRSDLFSVGILLYEMATGQRPFSGVSDAAMYDALLHYAPPAPTTVREGLPADIDLIIGRALEKDRELRYQSAADLAADLKRLHRPSSSAPLAAAAPPRPRRAPHAWWRAAAIAALLVASILAVALVVRRPTAGAPPTRFTVEPPPNNAFTVAGLGPSAMTVAVSPDGRRVLYLANAPGENQRIWVRSIDAVEATPIDDTDGAVGPFWSPDGRSLAFFVDRALKLKELAGGAARTLADIPISRGGTWGGGDVILLGTIDSGIFRVPAAGGVPVPVTTPDKSTGEQWHRFPQFLPDGRHFLYLAGTTETRTLFVGSIDGPLKKRVLETNARAIYADPGFLFFVGDDGALMTRPFDSGRLELTGDARQIGGRVAVSSTLNVSYAVGGSTLVYGQRSAETSQLTWFDRSGQPGGTVGTPGHYLNVRLSPDGHTAAVSKLDPAANTPDIWLLDIGRGTETRFTFSPSIEVSPVWSPDGSQLAFTASKGGRFEMDQRPAAGSAEASALFASDDAPNPEDWTADGQSIVFSTNPTTRYVDLKLLHLSDRQSTTLVASRFAEYQGRVSPDGRWLAYTADDSGRPEIYVRPFPSGTSSVLISIGGGTEPAWRRDGRELFYLSPNGALMSVSVTLSDVVKAGQPTELFRARLPADRQRNATTYAATADGRRFLIPAVVGDAPQPTITVVLNWSNGLQP